MAASVPLKKVTKITDVCFFLLNPGVTSSEVGPIKGGVPSTERSTDGVCGPCSHIAHRGRH